MGIEAGASLRGAGAALGVAPATHTAGGIVDEQPQSNSVLLVPAFRRAGLFRLAAPGLSRPSRSRQVKDNPKVRLIGIYSHANMTRHCALAAGLCGEPLTRFPEGDVVMRSARTLSLVCLGMFALCSLLASGASAAEASDLGASGTFTTKNNSTTTIASAGGGITIKCTSGEGSGEFLNSTSAIVDELFLGCTAGGFKCTGLKDTTTGSILSKWIEEYVDGFLGSLFFGHIRTLTEPVHVECLGILTEIRASVIGRGLNPAGEKTTKTTDSIVGKEGKNEITEIGGVNHHLESETGGSSFVETSLEQNVTTTGSEVEVMY